ncbi:MAG: TrkA family potassium uptake protein [Acidobacteriota bacterium]
MKSIAIIGLGSFGFNFAKNIQSQGIDVIAIDSNPDVVQAISEFIPRAIVADATDRKQLKDLGIDSVDVAVVSLGDRMDKSIIAVLHLKSLGIKEIFVKAISDEHAHILELLDVSKVIHPEKDAAERLAKSIVNPNILEYLPLMGEFSVMEIEAPEEFFGKNLVELNLRQQYGITVIAVSHSNKDRRIVAPTPSYIISKGSILVIIGENKDIERFQRKFSK